jgi:transcriptional regulator with XRE-family HTH domain
MSGENPRSAGQMLKREREIRGWSRKYVAERIGSDLQSVGRWERGETFPNAYYRQQLCELFEKDAIALGLISDGTSNLNQQAEPMTTYAQQARVGWQGEAGESERKQYFDGQARPIHPMPRLNIASQRLPVSIVISTLAIIAFALIFSATLWRLQANPLMPSTPRSPVRSAILPGGIWVSPIDGQSYRGTIHFAARAYPNSVSDPPISYGDFRQ